MTRSPGPLANTLTIMPMSGYDIKSGDIYFIISGTVAIDDRFAGVALSLAGNSRLGFLYAI